MSTPLPGQPSPANRAQWAKIQAAVVSTDEPARRLARVTAAVSTVVIVAAAFGLNLNEQTRNAMTTVGVLLFPAIVALGELIRARVVPVSKANAIIEAAYAMTPTVAEPIPKV